MTVRSDLMTAARTWVKTVLGVTDSKIIQVQRGRKGSRPPLPFLTVQLLTTDIPVGVDYRAHTDSLVEKRRGNRQGSLRIKGYGPGSDEQIAILSAYVDKAPDPLTIININNGVLDVSIEQGEAFEEQYVKDFLFEYAITSEDVAVEALTVDLDFDIADQTINIYVELT